MGKRPWLEKFVDSVDYVNSSGNYCKQYFVFSKLRMLKSRCSMKVFLWAAFMAVCWSVWALLFRWAWCAGLTMCSAPVVVIAGLIIGGIGCFAVMMRAISAATDAEL